MQTKIRISLFVYDIIIASAGGGWSRLLYNDWIRIEFLCDKMMSIHQPCPEMDKLWKKNTFWFLSEAGRIYRIYL